MSKNTNEKPAKQGPKVQVKESILGIFCLGVIVAEAVAAYVLYFSGNSLTLKVVAGVLVADAAVRATKRFTVIK